MRRKVIFILILLLLGYLGYSYLYQDHRDIGGETAEFVLSSEEVANQFLSHSEASEKKYLDKVLQIEGVITELNASDLTLNDAIFCQFIEKFEGSMKVGDSLVIKGRCIGYDDLLEQVKLNECSIIKK